MKVLFFAQLREVLDTESLTVDSNINNVAELRSLLQETSPLWCEHLSSERTLVAVNQEICDDQKEVHQGDEIAFFPPVTGG